MEGTVQKIALNEVHVQLGAKMMPFAGFNTPARYTPDTEGQKTVREGVGVFDVPHLGECVRAGPHASELRQAGSSNEPSALKIGQAQYGYVPNETGGVVDDLLVYRLAEEEYLLVVNASNIKKDWDWINRHNTMDAQLENISDRISLFAVQGPKAINVLQKLTSLKLDEIPYYHFAVGELAGVPDVIISATGYTGAGGFEVYMKNEDALHVWNAIFEAGEAFDIKPIGLGARD